MPSPLLDLPGAVAADGADADVAAHYGSFHGEQRTLVAGDGFVDLSHRGVFTISGPDRLTYLHAMTTQHTEHLEPGVPTEALLLSPQGHVEHHFRGVDDGSVWPVNTAPSSTPRTWCSTWPWGLRRSASVGTPGARCSVCWVVMAWRYVSRSAPLIVKTPRFDRSTKPSPPTRVRCSPLKDP